MTWNVYIFVFLASEMDVFDDDMLNAVVIPQDESLLACSFKVKRNKVKFYFYDKMTTKKNFYCANIYFFFSE